MSLVNLEVSTLGIERLVLDLNATEKQAEKALRSTLVKMASWLRTRSVRGLSKELEIQQKVLRRRLKAFRLKKSADGANITVWYGLDPVALIYLGARQTSSGVTAGRHKRKSAFIAKGSNGNKQVFKRRGKARLPIDKQVLDINNKAETFLEDRLIGSSEFETYFMTVLERELKWRTR